MSEKYFILSSGRALTNLEELAEALGTMPEEEFRSHANPERNDFSTWVRDVFHEHLLAQKLLVAKSREEMTAVLEDYFADMAKKLSKDVLKKTPPEQSGELMDKFVDSEMQSVKGQASQEAPKAPEKKRGFFARFFGFGGKK